MGRWVALLFLMATAGCTDGDAPPILVQDLGAGVVSDFAGGGGPCSTACDCPAGQACRMGVCDPAMPMVFCCGAMSCTGTALCEFPDGTFSQCDRTDGGGVTPVVDGGTTSAACEMTSCTRGTGGNAFCKLACGSFSAMCVRTGGIDHCTP
jgi:hypothetical protein